jgi:hypothetical protein
MTAAMVAASGHIQHDARALPGGVEASPCDSHCALGSFQHPCGLCRLPGRHTIVWARGVCAPSVLLPFVVADRPAAHGAMQVTALGPPGDSELVVRLSACRAPQSRELCQTWCTHRCRPFCSSSAHAPAPQAPAHTLTPAAPELHMPPEPRHMRCYRSPCKQASGLSLWPACTGGCCLLGPAATELVVCVREGQPIW